MSAFFDSNPIPDSLQTAPHSEQKPWAGSNGSFWAVSGQSAIERRTWSSGRSAYDAKADACRPLLLLQCGRSFSEKQWVSAASVREFQATG